MPHPASVCALAAMALVLGAHAATLERITIQVVNSAKMERTTLARAERDAALAFRQAGVDLQWRDCAAQTCEENLGLGEFWLHVALWRPVASCDRTMGFTFQRTDATASLAGVYYPMVREFAWDYGFNESTVLGPVLAHEIGHLLGMDHSVRGVMIAEFDRARIVQMNATLSWFTRDQASRMRAAVGRIRSAPVVAADDVPAR